MKKIKIVLGICFLIGFCSCSSDSSSSNGKTGGNITYIINGKTYTQTDGINAGFVDGKFMGCTDANLDAKIGDSESMSTDAETTKKCFIMLKADGVTYTKTSNKPTVTIKSFDGKTIKGTFSGTLYKDGDSQNIETPISGSFETNDITSL